MSESIPQILTVLQARELIADISLENELQKRMPKRFQQWSHYDRLVDELAKINPVLADCYRRDWDL